MTPNTTPLPTTEHVGAVAAPSKVYILRLDDCEDQWILGVFSSLEAACRSRSGVAWYKPTPNRFGPDDPTVLMGKDREFLAIEEHTVKDR